MLTRQMVWVWFLITLVAIGINVFRTPTADVVVEMSSTTASTARLFYDSGHGIHERNSRSASVHGSGLEKFQNLDFRFVARHLYWVGFEPLEAAGAFSIRSIRIKSSGFTLLSLSPGQFELNQEVKKAPISAPGTFGYTTSQGANEPRLSLRFIKPLDVRFAAVLPNVFYAALFTSILFLIAIGLTKALSAIGLFVFGNRSGTLVITLCALPWIALAPAFLFGLSQDPLVYMGDLLTQQRPGLLPGHIWVDPNVGFTNQALGKLAASDWLQGQIPWWNPYSGIGLPLAAEMQPSALFLPFVFLFHFANGVLFVKLILQAIAGVSTYFFLRAFGLAVFASFCGGILFEFAGMFAWISHAPVLPIAFLPLLFLGVELVRPCKSPRANILGMIWISVSIAWASLAGFPETAFLDGLLVLVWIFARFPDVQRGLRFSYALRIVAAGLGGVLLSTPVLLPFFEYQSLSAIGHTWGLDGLPGATFATFLNPYVFGPLGEFGHLDRTGVLDHIWGGIGGYLGLVLTFLAVTGLLGLTRLRLKMALLGWLVILFARTLGAHWAGWLMNLIPGVVLIAVPRYGISSCEFAAVILAAFALDDWQRGSGLGKRRILLASAVFLGLIGCSLAFSHGLLGKLFQTAPKFGAWFGLSLGGGLACAAGIGWLLSRPVSRKAAWQIGLLVATYSLAMYVIPTLSGFRNTVIDTSAIHFLQARLALGRFYTLGPIRPNYGTYYEIASINHNAIPISANWVNWVTAHLDSGVSASIFTGNEPQPTSDRIQQFKLHLEQFEDLGVRYLVAPSWTHACEGDPQAIITGAREHIDGLQCAYHDGTLAILELPHPAPYFDFQPSATCRILKSTRVALHLDCAQPAELVRRELYYPGWRASVNGRSTGVTRYGELFQSISLPAGQSRVVFSYVPSAIVWIEVGVGIGLGWLLGLLVYWAFLAGRKGSNRAGGGLELISS